MVDVIIDALDMLEMYEEVPSPEVEKVESTAFKDTIYLANGETIVWNWCD